MMAIFTFDQAIKKSGVKPSEVKSLGIGGTPPAATEEPKKPGLFSRVAEDITHA